MKLLYIAPVDINQKTPDGVAKKVMSHIKTFAEHYKFDCDCISYDGNIIKHNMNGEIKLIECGKKHRRYVLFDYVNDIVKNTKYDAVYIRYPKSERNFIKMLKNIKSSGAKIVIEIPTYPYNGNMFESLKLFFMASIDALYRRKLKKVVDRIVTFSDDDKIFGIETIKTINGVDFSSIKVKLNCSIKENDINLISVSTMWPCHGYDRLIEGIHNYYLNGGQSNIKFYIVGDGEESIKYRKLIEKYDLNNHVVLCGYKIGKELDNLYNRADIAVNSLAIHRIGLETESTLKTKEYAAKGLPIISSYPLDIFDEEDHEKYVLQLIPDDTPVDINSVIKFYHSLYSNNSDMHLSQKIRRTARNKCDMHITLKKVSDYYKLNGEIND